MRDDPRRPAWNFNIVQQASKEVRQGQVGARWVRTEPGIEWDLSLFGVRRHVLNPIPSDIIDLDRDGGGFRIQAGRAESMGWGVFRWYAGVEGEAQWDERLNFGNQQGDRGDLSLDQSERVRSLGLFVQGVAALSEGGRSWSACATTATGSAPGTTSRGTKEKRTAPANEAWTP
jgi:hypothetical protein